MQGTLRFENVSKRFGSFTAVDQVTLEGLKCTSLKTSGTGLKRTVTCVH